jgi:aldehyde:ferredoxin oxidoreductase
MGRILRVDLTTEQITTEPLTPSVARMWLGGTGLGARILYDEVPAGVEWDSPQNRLISPPVRSLAQRSTAQVPIRR